MKTDQASSPEELPGRLSEEDEDEHKDDPPNPVRYLSEVGFQSDQVGGFAISKIGEFSISKFSVFLSDPGKPGVRSLGPDVCPYVTFVRLN